MADNIIRMVLKGKMEEAFEKNYATDVIMQEINMDPFVGKDKNREREKQRQDGITEFRNAEVLNTATGDNISMVEWLMDYSHKEYSDVKMQQVAVQTRNNGKINKEIFYHS